MTEQLDDYEWALWWASEKQITGRITGSISISPEEKEANWCRHERITSEAVARYNERMSK